MTAVNITVKAKAYRWLGHMGSAVDFVESFDCRLRLCTRTTFHFIKDDITYDVKWGEWIVALPNGSMAVWSSCELGANTLEIGNDVF